MTLGERIRWVRGDLKQKEFAAKIGVTQSTVGYWERQNNIPKERDRLKISEVFGVNLLWLLTGEGEPYVAGRKTPNISTPLKPGTREEGGYQTQEERLSAGGGEPSRVYDPADSAVQNLASANLKLLEKLDEKDKEINRLRMECQDLWRRLSAKGEGRRNTDQGGQPEPV